MLTPEIVQEIANRPECHHGGDFARSVDPVPFARAVEAAATAEARALVELAVEELDDGMPHAVDCMAHYGSQYKCKCQKASTLAKLRAWIGEAQKGDGHA